MKVKPDNNDFLRKILGVFNIGKGEIGFASYIHSYDSFLKIEQMLICWYEKLLKFGNSKNGLSTCVGDHIWHQNVTFTSYSSC